MVRVLEDYQLIGRACKHSNMFSLPVLTPEDLTTSYVQLLLRRNTIKRISNKFLLLELVFYVVLKVQKPSTIPVVITLRSHLFPFRTQKLSSMVPKILSWRRLGKIGCCRILYSSIAQSVEHAAVNRRVVSSSLTGGAKEFDLFELLFLCLFFDPM